MQEDLKTIQEKFDGSGESALQPGDPRRHFARPDRGRALPLTKAPVLVIELQNTEGRLAFFDLIFRWGTLPGETCIHVAFEKLSGATSAVTARPEVLKRCGIAVLRPRQTAFPAERRGLDGKRTRFDLDRIYALSAARDTLIPGIRIPPARALAVALQIRLPADVTERPFRFDVVQQAGKRVVGGSACFV
jgi:hypothetical protein